MQPGLVEADAAAGSSCASRVHKDSVADPEGSVPAQEPDAADVSEVRPWIADSRLGLRIRGAVDYSATSGEAVDEDDAANMREVLAPAPGTVSNWGTVIVLAKSTVGGTLIVLPIGFHHAGIVPAAALLAVICAMEVFCMTLLIQCVRTMGRGNFGDIAREAMGLPLAVAVDISMVLSQVGFVCGEMLYFAKNLSGALQKVGWHTAPTPRSFLFLQLLLIVPMSWIRRLKHFTLPNAVANVVILVALGALAAVSIDGLIDGEIGPDPRIVGEPEGIVLFSGTSVFAFACINFVIPIYEEHERKEKFESVLSVTMAGVCMLFIFFGAVSYIRYGAETRDVVTLNLPRQSVVGKAVPFAFALASLLNVPLFLFPATTLMEGRLFAPGPSRTFGRKCMKNCLRTVTALVCAVLAFMGADRVEAFVALVGSLCCVPLAFIYPVLCHLRICRPGALGTCADFLIGACGVVLFLLTTAQALRELAHQGRGPPPFKPKPKPGPPHVGLQPLEQMLSWL